jgi:hypothetical protein
VSPNNNNKTKKKKEKKNTGTMSYDIFSNISLNGGSGGKQGHVHRGVVVDESGEREQDCGRGGL